MTAAARAAGPVAFRYRLYGLDLVSDLDLAPLPQVEPDASGDVVRIVRAPIAAAAVARDQPLRFVDTGAELLFAWAMVGAFRIASADRIEVDPNPGVPDSLAALPLLGTVLAALLQRRGLAVLHGSAVSVNGAAIVLLGHKGAGKSTTAGALAAAGHVLIADDVVAIGQAGAGRPIVLPAAAQLRLWDDSRAALSNETIVVDHGRLHALVDKSLYGLPRASTDAVPLGRLYLLARGASPGVRQIPSADAIGVLLNQSYMARFGARGFGATIPTHFARLAGLAASGRARILTVPAGLDRLTVVVPLVEKDLARG